jgi:SAM-dependent methyltransferase
MTIVDTQARRTDEEYYEVAPPHSLGERLAIVARDCIYDDMVRHCRPDRDDAILDVGVSDVVTGAANMMERKYPHPGRITAVGLGDGVAFRAAYPKVVYRRIRANRPLPFADKAFDIAVSNAVLEHVGSIPNQMAFVRELCRVADRVFISVPNRYFPVEHHTMIPLLHFWQGAFDVACRCLGKTQWTDPRNLILMSLPGLAALAPAGTTAAIGSLLYEPRRRTRGESLIWGPGRSAFWGLNRPAAKERIHHGQGHRHRPRHHQFLRRSNGRQIAPRDRERGRHAHHTFDRRILR